MEHIVLNQIPRDRVIRRSIKKNPVYPKIINDIIIRNIIPLRGNIKTTTVPKITHITNPEPAHRHPINKNRDRILPSLNASGVPILPKEMNRNIDDDAFVVRG
jgi:hypothetical protein